MEYISHYIYIESDILSVGLTNTGHNTAVSHPITVLKHCTIQLSWMVVAGNSIIHLMPPHKVYYSTTNVKTKRKRNAAMYVLDAQFRQRESFSLVAIMYSEIVNISPLTI